MKCKLVNTKKIMTFCRFLRLNDDVGFHMQDGRGEERISYFGNGFHKRECGISIANADDNDKSPWKCFIGVDDDNKLKTMGAIIDGSDPPQTTTQGLSHYFALKLFLFLPSLSLSPSFDTRFRRGKK